MINAESINLGLAIVAVFSVVFGIYNYFRKPQEDQEQKLALQEKDIGSKATILAQKEMENKAALLDQQVKLEREANERKFAELGVRLDNAFALAQNHIHTVDTKVDNLITSVNTMGNDVTKLSTIIEERIPKRTI